MRMTLLAEFPVRSPSGVTLSPPALALWRVVQAAPEGVPESVARAQLGAALPGVVQELCRAWVVLVVPGAPGGKAARQTRLVAAPVMEEPTRLELTFAARRLSGQSGTLLALSRRLDRSPGHTLGVLRALTRAELAQGGPVGATFAVRVAEMSMRGSGK